MRIHSHATHHSRPRPHRARRGRRKACDPERADVVHPRYATTNGERDEHLVRNRFDHAVEESPGLDACLDVEKRELVRALLIVAASHLDRIAGVAQIDEVHALHHAPAGDIEAGDDAFRESHDS